MKKYKTGIWLITNDQRIEENENIENAINNCEQVLPIFIWDIKLKRCSANSNQASFFHQSLTELNKLLRPLNNGIGLYMYEGDTVNIIEELITTYQAEALYIQNDFTPVFSDFINEVKDKINVEVSLSGYLSSPDSILKEDGSPYLTFSSFARAWFRTGPEDKTFSEIPKFKSTKINIKQNFNPSNKKFTFTPVRSEALKRLLQFLDSSLNSYNVGRNMLDTDGTSMISPYLRSGIISINEAFNLGMSRDESLTSPGIKSWINELLWREFNMYIMHHFPEIISSSFNNKLRDYPWEMNNDYLNSWKNGLTGYPIVDSCMKQLTNLGWMHNRGRMIVASFLTKDLFIDWREGEKWFMENLVDADTASNVGGWQWTAGSGVDAAPYFRIFNPITQGKKFDPDGKFVKYWINELNDIPSNIVHEPWLSEDEVKSPYDSPIVDHAQARAKALLIFNSLKK